MYEQRNAETPIDPKQAADVLKQIGKLLTKLFPGLDPENAVAVQEALGHLVGAGEPPEEVAARARALRIQPHELKRLSELATRDGRKLTREVVEKYARIRGPQ